MHSNDYYQHDSSKMWATVCVFVLQTPRLLAGNKTDLHMEERCCLSSHTVPFWLTQAQRSTRLSSSFTTKTLYLSRTVLYQMLMSPRAPERFLLGFFFFFPDSFWSESFHPAALTEFQICFIFVHVSNTKEMGEVSIYLFVLQSVWSLGSFFSIVRKDWASGIIKGGVKNGGQQTVS